MSQVPRLHPELFEVVKGSGKFSTTLRARRRFEAGSVVVPITGVRTARRDYSTVQCGPLYEDNIRLACEIVYVNHSCDPNTTFDVSSEDPLDWHVRALRTIEEGHDLTFFYPSTEWDMAQPFACHCGAANCLGVVRGSKYLSQKQLHGRGTLSPWVRVKPNRE